MREDAGMSFDPRVIPFAAVWIGVLVYGWKLVAGLYRAGLFG